MLFLVSYRGWAASFGNLNSNNLQSSATVCLEIGTSASLSGLDNFTLENTDNSGAAGSIYTGSDTFTLESNAPVRVIAEGGILTSGEYSISTNYFIDDNQGSFNTSEEGAHNSNHVLTARAQLGRISNQISGDYSAVITLTVVPQTGGAGGCGEFINEFNTDDGWVTLAYEDLYPNVGDADYNDMVVRYSVQENFNAQQQLETISLQFDPLARGAGYNHSFSLSLDGELDKSKNVTTLTSEAFVGDALISVSFVGDNINHTFNNYSKEDDITIFSSTRSVLDGFANVYEGQEWINAKFITTVNITLANPELNLFEDRGEESILKYRPFLHVNNTNSDIDLAIINSNDGMVDANGNPFGLFIPYSWEWPLERINIVDAYPLFADYIDQLNNPNEELSEDVEEWYKYPSGSGLIFTRD